MKDWIKVWWHCLMNTFPLMSDHRQCTQVMSVNGKRFATKHFCSCGYLNGGISWAHHYLKLKDIPNSEVIINGDE